MLWTYWAVQESCSVEIYMAWKRAVLPILCKQLEGIGTFLFKKQSNKSGQKNWRWRSLTIFTKEATPKRVQNLWGAPADRCSPWPHLSRTRSRRRWSSHGVKRAPNRGDSVRLIEQDGCGQLSWQRADPTTTLPAGAQSSCSTYHP